jgi:hypothetical protein
MTEFKLSLPTDIPWRRICVSSKMLDPVSCDDERPKRWQPSLAAFRYDPADDYQPYDNAVVSYIKVTATLTPVQEAELATPELDGLPHEVIDEIEESYPCYGAVLQVSVYPKPDEKDKFDLSQYPYFHDCQPEHRELYEAVTDTGEALTGSASNLSVGKSATDTYSTDHYELDLGGGGGFNVGYSGLGVGGSWQDAKNSGHVTHSGYQVQNLRTTDFSTERREVLSHSTQLSQMYNLFQAFHLGTNRVLFLIEPRPHIRNNGVFINGPRALEGMQEVFLVVVRPKAMNDFCISALLETAHLTFSSISEPSTTVVHQPLSAGPPTSEKEPGAPLQWSDTEGVLDYDPDPGWMIDTTRPGGAYTYHWTKKKGVTSGPTFTVTPDHLHAEVLLAEVTSAIYEADVTIYVRSIEEDIVTGIHHLFMTARELCCCPPKKKPMDTHGRENPTWVSYDTNVKKKRYVARSGVMSQDSFVESRQIAATIHEEMIRSTTSSKRMPRGELAFVDSDAFHDRVTDAIRMSPRGDRLERSLAEVKDLDDETRGKLYSALGDLSVGEVLETDAAVLGRALESDMRRGIDVKRTLIRGLADRWQDQRSRSG